MMKIQIAILLLVCTISCSEMEKHKPRKEQKQNDHSVQKQQKAIEMKKKMSTNERMNKKAKSKKKQGRTDPEDCLPSYITVQFLGIKGLGEKIKNIEEYGGRDKQKEYASKGGKFRMRMKKGKRHRNRNRKRKSDDEVFTTLPATTLAAAADIEAFVKGADPAAFEIMEFYLYKWGSDDENKKYYYIDDSDCNEEFAKQFTYLAAMGQLGLYQEKRDKDMYLIEEVQAYDYYTDLYLRFKLNTEGCEKLDLYPDTLFAAAQLMVAQEVTIGGTQVQVPEIEMDGYKWGEGSIYGLKDVKYYRTTEAHDFYSIGKKLGGVDEKQIEIVHPEMKVKKGMLDDNVFEYPFEDWKDKAGRSYVSSGLIGAKDVNSQLLKIQGTEINVKVAVKIEQPMLHLQVKGFQQKEETIRRLKSYFLIKDGDNYKVYDDSAFEKSDLKITKEKQYKIINEAGEIQLMNVSEDGKQFSFFKDFNIDEETGESGMRNELEVASFSKGYETVKMLPEFYQYMRFTYPDQTKTTYEAAADDYEEENENNLRGQLVAFDYIMYPNIKKYLADEIEYEPDAEDRDELFNMVNSLSEEYVTKEVNAKIEEKNNKLADAFFQKSDNCHYLVKKIARPNKDGEVEIDPGQTLRIKKLNIEGYNMVIQYGSMDFLSPTNQVYSKYSHVKSIPMEIVFMDNEGNGYQNYCILECAFDPKLEACDYQVSLNQRQQVKVVKKDECAYTMPQNERQRKQACKQRLDAMQGSLFFESVDGVQYEMESAKNSDDKTVYNFKTYEKTKICLKIDMLTETTAKGKLKKTESKSGAKLKEINKKSEKKMMKKVVEQKKKKENNAGQMNKMMKSKKHQKKMRI